MCFRILITMCNDKYIQQEHSTDELNEQDHSLVDECVCVGGPTLKKDDGGYRRCHDCKKIEDVYVGSGCARTRLLKYLDSGSFGEVFLGRKLDTKDIVAVKVESQGSSPQQLLYEGSVYRALAGGPGIACVYWYGLMDSVHNAMVMEQLGPNLDKLLKEYNEPFSLSTVLQLIDQMISAVQYIHSKNYVHRDISPNNFVMGVGSNKSRVYLIDFGQAKKYSLGPNFITGRRHFQVARPLVGTPRFASIHSHKGHEASRRDDMESLAYVWIYLLKGRLPWQGIERENHQEKLAAICEMKQSLLPSDLCEGLPDELTKYLTFTRQLKQYDIPHYDSIKEHFNNLSKVQGFKCNGIFDWHNAEVENADMFHDDDYDKTTDNIHRESKISTSSNETVVSH